MESLQSSRSSASTASSRNRRKPQHSPLSRKRQCSQNSKKPWHWQNNRRPQHSQNNRRLAALAEQQRLAALAEQQKAAALAEQQKLAALAEQQRLAALAEQQKAAALAEQHKAAALAEQQKAAVLAEHQRAAALAEQQKATALAQAAAAQAAAIAAKPIAPPPVTVQTPRPFEPFQVASIAANPFSKGTAKANGDFQVGDRYTYRVTDLFTKLELRQSNEVVTSLTDIEVIYNDGRMVTDYLGNYVIDDRRRGLTASQYFATEYKVGKKWTTTFVLTRSGRGRMMMKKGGGDGETDKVELEFKVIGKESITVPAGTFDAFKVEGSGFVEASGSRWHYVYWIAPDTVRRFVAMEYSNRGRRGGYNAHERYELQSFSQGTQRLAANAKAR